MSHKIDQKNEDGKKKPIYGNWVSNKLIRKVVFLFLFLAIPDIALLSFSGDLIALKTVLSLLAAFCLTAFGYFCRARQLFSAEGGGIQNKVLDLLMSHIEWDGNGKALDIGCGSGALTIKIAKKYSRASVTGIDYWGKGWDYSAKQCRANAQAEGVPSRTEFEHASASKLPFPDGTFDLIVSNLTFHEVKDSKNRLEVIKEALRVLKPGGRFVFQDLFLIERYYGAPEELAAAVRAMDVKDLRFEDTSKALFIPRALKLPFMIGTLGLISGTKS